jgi:hypothetical protein
MAAMSAVELQVFLDEVEVDAPYIVECINDDALSLRLPGANWCQGPTAVKGPPCIPR